MSGLIESVVAIQRHLDAAGIHSMVIGGLAVAVWGEPRLTRDADLKVLLGRDAARSLMEALTEKYRPLQDNPLDSIRVNGFVFLEDAAGTRIDLLLADTSFDEEAIRRARPVEMAPGRTAVVCTAEDLVILKMISTRPRDHDDARGVIRRQGRKLDDVYVLGWLRQFEQALDDSTLCATYQEMRARPAPRRRT
jgi:hypothetical protein